MQFYARKNSDNKTIKGLNALLFGFPGKITARNHYGKKGYL